MRPGTKNESQPRSSRANTIKVDRFAVIGSPASATTTTATSPPSGRSAASTHRVRVQSGDHDSRRRSSTKSICDGGSMSPDTSRQRSRKHTVAGRPEGLDMVISREERSNTPSVRTARAKLESREPRVQNFALPKDYAVRPVLAHESAPSRSSMRRNTVKIVSSEKPRKPTTPSINLVQRHSVCATTGYIDPDLISIGPPMMTSACSTATTVTAVRGMIDIPRLQISGVYTDCSQPVQVPSSGTTLSRHQRQDTHQSQRHQQRQSQLKHPQSAEECVRVLREACERNDDKLISELQDQLRQVAGSIPKTSRVDSKHATYRAQLFCSSAMAAARPKDGSDQGAALFFEKMHETGLLCQMVNSVWRNEVPRDSAAGRAVMTLLRQAALNPLCRPAVREVYRYNPAGLLRCCRDCIGDPFSGDEMKRNAAQIVHALAEDTEVRRAVHNEDPILVALAEAMIRPQLHSGNDFSLVLPQHDESPLLFSDGVKPQPHMTPIEMQRKLEQLRKPYAPMSAPRAVLDEYEAALNDFQKEKDEILSTLDCSVAMDRVLEMLQLAIDGQRLESFSRVGGDTVLLQLMDRSRDNKAQLIRGFNIVARACAADSSYRARITRDILGMFTVADTAGCKETLRAHVSLMSPSIIKKKPRGGWGICESDDDGKTIAMLNRQLSELEAAAEAIDEYGIRDVSAFLRNAIADPYNGLTLEKAHRQLQIISKCDTLDAAESVVVERLFSYIIETLGIYARSPETVNAHQLLEQEHGNRALRLLGTARPNEGPMLRANVQQLLLDGIRSQTTLAAMQEFVLTAESLCISLPSLAMAMADHPDGPGVAAQSVVRARTALGTRPMPEIEEVMAPRLHLVRLMARNRQIFANTPIADYLLQLLDDCDEYYFGDIRFTTDESLEKALGKSRRSPIVPMGRALTRKLAGKSDLLPSPTGNLAAPSPSRHASEFGLPPWTKTDTAVILALHVPVMETLRRVFCHNFEEVLLQRNMPHRLLGLVIQSDTNPAVLHHVLFLVGALCANPKIRTQFVRLSGAERVMDLLRRAYPQENGKYVTEVVCNGSMALASVVVGDDEACSRFATYGGVATAVSMLNARASFNDPHGVNGASSLICNLSFRNDAARGALGEAGACDALVNALRLYRRGGENTARSLCMAAVFRAIGNLALTSANVEKFMDADVPTAYAAFLEQADGRLDDATLESCFRTLAILVWEVGTLQRFQCSTIPVLTLLRKCVGNNSDVYRWAFECIGQLCRYPRSAEIFIREAGADTILSVLPFLTEDRDLFSAALFALGIQTSERRNVPKLVEAGVVSFAHRFVSSYFEDCVKFVEQGGKFSTAPAVIATLSPSYSEGPAAAAAAAAAAAIAPAGTNSNGQRGRSATMDDGPQMPSSMLVVTAMRVLRRVIVGERNCLDYADSRCLADVLGIYKLSWQRPVVAYECLRVIFCVLGQLGGDSIYQNCASLQKAPTRCVGVVSDATYDESITVGSVSMASIRTQQTKRNDSPPRILTSAVRLATERFTPKHDVTTRGSPLLRAKHLPGFSASDLPRSRRPCDTRSWQKAGLSERDAQLLIEITRRVLADSRNHRDLRLHRLGIGMLCYWACEKVAFEALYQTLQTSGGFANGVLTISPSIASQASNISQQASPPPTSKRRFPSLFRAKDYQLPGDANFGLQRPHDDTAIIELLGNVFERFEKDELIMESAELLLAHMVLCITDGNEARNVADRNFFLNSRKAVLHGEEVPYFAQEVMSLYRRFLEKGWQGPCESMKEGYSLVDYEFPIALSGWADDPFPEVLPTDRMELLTLDMGGKADRRLST